MKTTNGFIDSKSFSGTNDEYIKYNKNLVFEYYLAFYNERFDVLKNFSIEDLNKMIYWIQCIEDLNILYDDIVCIANGSFVTIYNHVLEQAVIQNRNISLARMFAENGNNNPDIKALSEVKIKSINSDIEEAYESGQISTKDLSDGHHTFETLYDHRAHLFAALCNQNPNISFKTTRHCDEENDPMFDGAFMAGIYTPKGVVTYHFKKKYWDLFHVTEAFQGPRYDGYTDADVYERIDSLTSLSKKNNDNSEKQKVLN